MSFGNIVGGLLRQGISSQSHRRLQTGTANATEGGGLDQILGSFLGGQGGASRSGASGGLADMARDFLGKEQVGGLSGAKIGGLGAAAGGLLGGGLGGAAKGGAMAILGTLALKAMRDHQANVGSEAASDPPSPDQVNALTNPDTELLVLRAMIGAAHVDGHVDEKELDKILGQMDDDEVTESERQTIRDELNRPVDVEGFGSRVSRPEVAVEVYLAALLAVDVDTDSEKDYLRRLARSLHLDRGVVERLHRMTGAPDVA